MSGAPPPGPPAAQSPARWTVRCNGLAAFGLLCLSVPVAHAVWHWLLGHDEPLQRTAATAPRPAFDLDRLLAGTLQPDLERWLQEDSPVTGLLRGTLREWQARLGVLDSDQVFVGRDDWLFQRHTLAPDRRAIDARAAGRRALFAAVRREASELGVSLLVAVVPDKVSIYPDHAVRRGPPRTTQEWLYPLVLGELADAGLTAVDLRAALRAVRAARSAGEGPIYHPWDSHWTPAGALAAGYAVAAALQACCADRLGPEWQVELTGPAVLEALPGLVALTGVRTERVWSERAQQHYDRPASIGAMRWLAPMEFYGVAAVPPEGGLRLPFQEFAERAPIAMAGSSFSVTHGAAALALAAKRPVDVRSVRAGAVTVENLAEVFDRIRSGASTARIVVWEFVERALVEGLGAEPWRAP